MGSRLLYGVIDPSRPPVRGVAGISRIGRAMHGDAPPVQARVVDRRAELPVDRKPRDTVHFDRSPHALLERRTRGRRGHGEKQRDASREQYRSARETLQAGAMRSEHSNTSASARVRRPIVPPWHPLVLLGRHRLHPLRSSGIRPVLASSPPFGIPNRGQRQTTVNCPTTSASSRCVPGWYPPQEARGSRHCAAQQLPGKVRSTTIVAAERCRARSFRGLPGRTSCWSPGLGRSPTGRAVASHP